MSEALAKALSHPLRAQIFGRLAERPGSGKQLSEELDRPLSSTAYHVRKLHDLGLVELVEKVQRRGVAERIYRAVCVAPDETLDRRDVPTSVLDLEGWKEVAGEMHRTLTTIDTVRGRSARRLAASKKKGIDATPFLGSFESPDPKRKKRK
jgi:DNA-binding transcriptional ArsR family regulator